MMYTYSTNATSYSGNMNTLTDLVPIMLAIGLLVLVGTLVIERAFERFWRTLLPVVKLAGLTVLGAVVWYSASALWWIFGQIGRAVGALSLYDVGVGAAFLALFCALGHVTYWVGGRIYANYQKMITVEPETPPASDT